MFDFKFHSKGEGGKFDTIKDASKFPNFSFSWPNGKIFLAIRPDRQHSTPTFSIRPC